MQKSSLSNNEFTLWLKYIEYQVGFILPNSQLSWIKGIIERHMHRQQLTSTELLEKIVQDKKLYHELFDDILIPRTQFFRHMATFDFIRTYVQAWQQYYNFECIDKSETSLETIAVTSSQTRLPLFTAWSVGCASGQEAASMVLTIDQILGDKHDYKVFASDFHQQALQQAKIGRYDNSEKHYIPSQFHSKLQVIDNKQFQLESGLRQHLHYFSKNLVDYHSLLPIARKQCQIIMCENVLIYFRQFEQRDILNFLTQYLADDGVLLLSAGQSVSFSSLELKRMALPTVNAFCKTKAPKWVQQLEQL